MSRLGRAGFLGFGLPTSPPIGEALVFDPHSCFGEALVIMHAERHAFVVAKIEFAKIAFQVLL